MSVIIYTDGSAKGDPGNGGYGVVMAGACDQRTLEWVHHNLGLELKRQLRTLLQVVATMAEKEEEGKEVEEEEQEEEEEQHQILSAVQETRLEIAWGSSAPGSERGLRACRSQTLTAMQPNPATRKVERPSVSLDHGG